MTRPRQSPHDNVLFIPGLTLFTSTISPLDFYPASGTNKRSLRGAPPNAPPPPPPPAPPPRRRITEGPTSYNYYSELSVAAGRPLSPEDLLHIARSRFMVIGDINHLTAGPYFSTIYFLQTEEDLKPPTLAHRGWTAPNYRDLRCDIYYLLTGKQIRESSNYGSICDGPLEIFESDAARDGRAAGDGRPGGLGRSEEGEGVETRERGRTVDEPSESVTGYEMCTSSSPPPGAPPVGEMKLRLVKESARDTPAPPGALLRPPPLCSE
ncbi:hypothetical protein EVAR_8858_1 [Eumeta japonica]|uniref:Uncharacterized protein n=1 Tax=Eumeta variegata TaxID=151549 RepID=A0A4C1TU14_EUMVA|nr:hypothetical protein EVAR_8858_1 [Eumeta japonica]